MKNLLAVVGGRLLEEVKKNWSSSLLQAKGMGKSTDEGGHFSAVSLSLSALHIHSYLLLGFFWRAGRSHGHPWSPCSFVLGRKRRAEKKKKKKPKKVIRSKCTFRPKHTETPRNFTRGGMGGCLVPVCIPVQDFPSILDGTECNIQLCLEQSVDQRKHDARVQSNM